ncbi:helix-turn-helix domain-containing protein [Sphingomonas sp. BT-65]|uniref:AraC family transcriptional regulator n=1 Tax=Sphingomonas sp. BT-65 TaxID=2989821 RepID=UPI002235C765|nr:helix-turn-helix domain-containing protein [Sphingomonas sp. BT-65]MCW4461388.1 helix-turn-helix domain-containing protein [Sphingomonas sp. BT-65]
MHYAETPPPPELEGLVEAVWTLNVATEGWVDHQAVPDGCIELIRRHSGRSVWRREQPGLFVTGLALRPAMLRFSGDARFTGIRLWPWAWHALGGAPCRDFADDWRPVNDDSPLAALFPDDGDPTPRLAAAFRGLAPPPLAAIRHVASVALLARLAGLSERQLQRICARETGMPPRSYLRLLRFRTAVAAVQRPDALLADTATASGYADQAHMTREFRSLGGLPPARARKRAKGPFI